MSEYSFACPNCSQKITIDASRAGQKMACPTCRHSFISPPPQPPTAPPSIPVLPPVQDKLRTKSSGSGPPPVPTAGFGSTPLGTTSDVERQVLEGGRFVIFQ